MSGGWGGGKRWGVVMRCCFESLHCDGCTALVCEREVKECVELAVLMKLSCEVGGNAI